MARRKSHEEHANHEAWAIPYADLMTLLLAFFVVMYAISSLNEGKYRVMADALTTAFGGAPRTITQVQVGHQQLQGGGHDTPAVIRAPSMTGGAVSDPTRLPSMASQMTCPVSLRDREQLQRAERQLGQIAEKLTRALAPLVSQGVISVRRTELWIEVEINSDILFATGSAALDADARQTLGKLADVLRDVRPRSTYTHATPWRRWPRSCTTRPTACAWKAIPTTCRSPPRNTRPTGNCRPRVPPAWCTCSPTTACSHSGWR